MTNVIAGMLYKKILNEDGTVKEHVPFLLKTLAKLVILEDGTTVQDSINELRKNKTKVFQTIEDYDAARIAGTVSDGEMCVIKND